MEKLIVKASNIYIKYIERKFEKFGHKRIIVDMKGMADGFSVSL